MLAVVAHRPSGACRAWTARPFSSELPYCYPQVSKEATRALSQPWSLVAGGVLVSSGWSPTIPILVATDSENGVVVVGKPAEKSRRDTISSAAPLRLISAAECIRFQYGSRHRCIRACSISYSRWEASFHMEFICSSVHSWVGLVPGLERFGCDCRAVDSAGRRRIGWRRDRHGDEWLTLASGSTG